MKEGIITSKLLTTRELQDYLHLDRITIYRMLETGEIPAMKVGGQWRFSQTDIEEWLKRCQAKRPTPPARSRPLPPAEALAIAARPLAALHISDLVAPSCLEIIQGGFAEALGVSVGITDLTDAPVVPFSNSCAFCQYGWSSPLYWQRCQASWVALSTGAEAEPKVHVCHAGINYAAAPVLVQGQRLGLVVTGQFLPAVPDAAFLRRVRQMAQECNLDANLLVSKVNTIRTFTPERVQLTTRLLVTIAIAVSEIANQNFQVRQKLAQVAQIVGSV